MDSFYGGKQGISFVLKGSFESVNDMITAFKRGNEYQDIWFDEFCLIDTPNKNDKDNGRLYQRGLDYTNSMGGAIYVGQIVGSSAGTPLMQLNTLKEVTDKSTMAIGEDDYRKYPIGYETDGQGHVTGYKYNTDANEPIAIFPFSKAHDTSLVPGKTEEGKFNDEIRWTWVNIRKPNQESDSWFYLGLELPYLVSEYTTTMVSPYDEHGNLDADPTYATRTDDETHPFFMSWDFGIPKGIKGDALRNLRIITPTSADSSRIYLPSAITVNDNGAAIVGEPGYSGLQDDITNQRQILVYDMYIFDNLQNPDPIMIYLGDNNMIDDISLADDGTLTIEYTHDDNTVFSRKIKWITSTTLSPDTGIFTVTYNNGDPAFTTTLDWIKEIVLDDDGTIHYIHTANNRDEAHNNAIKWVDSVDLNTTTGVFTMNFNYGDPLTRQLDWVDDIYIDEDTGEIVIHHVNAAVGEDGEVTLPAKLKLITSADAAANGVVTFRTNTGESFTLKQTENQFQDFQIKRIDDVILNTRLADDKRILIKYNTETSNTPIGDPINYVQDMVVRESDFHLLVLFNDPTHRASAEDLDGDGKDENGITWVQNVTGSNGVLTSAGIYWRDYGTIKDQSGILIGLNLTKEDVGETPILDYLNTTYPNGLTEGATKQKVVTYAPNEDDTKDFYAFDYDDYKWYYLGTIADSGIRDVLLITQGSFTGADLENLSSDGLAFKIINTTGLKTTAMPDFWSRTYTNWQ